MERLGVNKVFLYQLHNPDIDIIKEGEVFGILEEFRNEGLIDWYGVSINRPDEGLAVIETCREKGLEGLVALQVIYSILTKHGFSELFAKAKLFNIAIITREVLLRGFLTDKYNSNTDFSFSPSAVKKLLKLYSETELHRCIEEVKYLIANYNLTLAQASLGFSLHNPDVTVTLAGINRSKYFQEDWSSLEIKLPDDLVNVLNKTADIKVS